MEKKIFIYIILFVACAVQLSAEADSLSVYNSTTIIDLDSDSTTAIEQDVAVVDMESDQKLENSDAVFSNLFWCLLLFASLFFILYVANLTLGILSVVVFSSIGLVNTSTWVNLMKKSYNQRFKALFFMSNAVFYSLIGGILLFLVNTNYQSLPIFFVIVIGLVWGALFSFPLGALFISLMRKVIRSMIKDKDKI